MAAGGSAPEFFTSMVGATIVFRLRNIVRLHRMAQSGQSNPDFSPDPAGMSSGPE